jgi:hypothetical protein
MCHSTVDCGFPALESRRKISVEDNDKMKGKD